MKLADLIQETERQLNESGVHFGHGTDNAHDEAAWLVLHALGLPLDSDLHDAQVGGLIVSPEHQAQAALLLQKRISTRQPLAYLTHQAWLQGVPFYVDERTIVPRSLIAEVIADGNVDPWLTENTRRVLDLCTGNGSLAVLAAMAWPEVTVDAVDISTDALAVARINVDQHGLSERIRLIESDGFAQCQGVYDLVLCNPPYVNRASMEALPAEFQAEPSLALAGGSDGMDFIRAMLAAAPRFLSESGVLVLEIGHEREHFEAAFPDLHPVWIDTSAGSDQVLLLARQ
ncbi:50S ribosomal protein L3 N(5)-glutamine methyltransferase [Ottowia thiooxydans]|uniref:50S ribosomal protein L3 N(5)-glutamine methyltransferase n=1 Tax=Ottowia thiooxydans TaxID=219182 RepID=UPI0003F8A3B2|nr:50S ribosomal protein L3 N(5)-glutamine methyltransferase [Ottowia thiooxydans]